MSESTDVSVSPKRSKWFRLRRMPTWRIWLPVLLMFGLLFVLLVPKIHGWLAVTERVANAKYVVVEGWAPDHVILAAEREFDDLDARMLFTTGLPLDAGSVLVDYKDFATLAATTLAKVGMDPAKICPAPAKPAPTERTANMVRALKATLDSMNIPAEDKTIQLVTYGTHARRSWKIYQQVLGPDWKVGVVSVPSQNYAQERWYRTSEGAKGVIDELAALAVHVTGDASEAAPAHGHSP